MAGEEDRVAASASLESPSDLANVRRTLTFTDGEEEEGTAGLLQNMRSPSLHPSGKNAATTSTSNGANGRAGAEGWAGGGLKPTTSAEVSEGFRRPASASALLGACLVDAKVSAWHMLLGNKMNVLLLGIPIGIASHYYAWGSGLTAVLSLLSLCPLAERLGFTTEQLALRTNDTLGALLNVTFGNATELILSIVALREGEIELIQLSLVGSILSNMLLVLGSAMVIGGVRHKVQLFERQSAILHVGLLFASSVALAIPIFLALIGYGEGGGGPAAAEGEAMAIVWLSRFISGIMVTVYGLFLYYILKLEKKEKDNGRTVSSARPDATTPEKFSILHLSQHVLHRSSMDLPQSGRPAYAAPSKKATPADIEMAVKSPMDFADFESSAGPLHSTHGGGGSGRSWEGPLDPHQHQDGQAEAAAEEGAEEGAEEEEEEIPVLSTCSGVFWLGIVAILISYMSDILVANIEDGAAAQLHVPAGFLYTIIVPIVGNAAEHTSALMFSYRNKPDIAFGIAVGSSVQIALLVIPAIVLIAWPMGQTLTLSFGAFETCVYGASVVLLLTCISDGRSNWPKGALLIAAYFCIGVGVWFA